MTERESFKSSRPPVIEMQPGDDASIERGHSLDAQRAMRNALIGERAVELLNRHGELLGVVEKTDQSGASGKVVIDLSDADLGTEVFLDNRNPYAKSHNLHLPSTVNELVEGSRPELTPPTAVEKATQPRRSTHAHAPVDDDDYFDNFSLRN